MMGRLFRSPISRIAAATWVTLGFFPTPLAAETQIIFNQPVDHRYAWIGNEAEGEVDFQARLTTMIRDAGVSIDVSSMSFTVTEIADELAAAAERGVAVRIHGNAGHRYQPGYHAAMKGPAQVLDNNLPALIHRINFQQNASPVPAGFLADTGDVYGPKGGGLSYGWTTDVSSLIQSHTGIAPGYTSAMLGDVYVQDNDIERSWEIAVPDGYYYAYVMAGHPTQACHTNVKLEGNAIFYKNDDPGFDYVANTDPDKHESSPVEGGRTDGNLNAKRVYVSDGNLTLTVGYPAVPGNSCLNFIEIYRGSAAEEGDANTDKQYVQQRQLIHSKYLIFDAGTASQKLWASSGNLTGGMSSMSEDALITDQGAIIDMFSADFNARWGAASILPNPAGAAAGWFKPSSALTTASVYNATLDMSFPWHTYFSPTNASYDMYSVLADYIDTSESDLLFLMEQFTGSGNLGGTPYGTLSGTDSLREQHLKDLFLDLGRELYGVFGNENPSDEIFALNSYPGAHLAQVPWTETYSIHTKAALSDTLGDTRHRRKGRVLMGSMNWSQGGMHINDEHTLVIEDPMLANQYLQRAMAALAREGIEPSQETDIILVLDRSYSMNDATPSGTTKIEATRMAASLFLDLLETDQGHRVSIVRFGETVEPFTPPLALDLLTSSYRATLHTAIAGTDATLPIGNATSYGAGLSEALSQFQDAVTPKPRRLIHFFTDGKENEAPFAAAVKNDLYAEGVEIHSTAFGSFDIYGSGPTAVLDELATNSGGTFAQLPDDPVALQKRFAEVARDAMELSTLIDPTFTLSSKQKAFESAFLVDEGMAAVKVLAMWNQPVSSLAALALTAPDGKPVDASLDGVRVSEAKGYQVWHIDLRALNRQGVSSKGTWHLTGKAADGFRDIESAQIDLMVSGSGGVRFDAEIYPIPKQRNTMQLVARALDQQQKIPQMDVVAVWRSPAGNGSREEKTITLYDDGKHGDRAANDGIFGNTVELRQEGNHSFRLIAEGTDKVPFQREAMLYATTQSENKPEISFWQRLLDWLMFWQ